MIVSLLPLEGGDGLLIPLLPPSFGRRWRVAPEVGFALFRLRPTPCPSGIPLPWEGGGWASHPSFLWKEVAQSAGGWLRSFFPSANPRPSGIPLPWEGGRCATHPASPSFLWKEVARSAGGWLRSFSLSANPLPWEGDRWATHPASPSFLWKEVARSAGGWLRSLSPSATPLPFGHPPFHGKAGMGYSSRFSLLPLEGGGA